MPLLHDDATRASLKRRLAGLRPDAVRRWGKMSVDQMLHHLNHALRSALGREPASLEVKLPIPNWLAKFSVLHLPWPRGAPTAPEWISGDRYDFGTEQQAVLALIDELATKPVDGPGWPRHFQFGEVGGRYWSAVNAKNIAHHLRQFSA